MNRGDGLVGPPWGVADFLLVILTGIGGAFVVVFLLVAYETDAATTVAWSSIGMSSGHAAGIYAVLRRRSAGPVDLGFEVVGNDGLFLLLGAALQFLIAFAFYPLSELVDSDGTTQVVADQIASAEGVGIRVALVILVGLVAPAMEELVFRGLLLRITLRYMKPWLGVVVTALIFSLFHWLGIDQSNVLAGLVTLAQLLIIGVALGALTIRHGRLGPAIFTHAGFNLVTLLLLFAPLEALGT